MSFTKFLIESRERTLLEKHDIVLQQIIDVIDSRHIDYSEDKIEFDIGTLIGQPKLKGLGVSIRKSKNGKSVKLGKNDKGYFIVIDTDEIPVRQDVDALLSSKDVYNGFGNVYNQYMKTYFDKNKEYDISDTEKMLSTNNRDAFEGYYNDLVNAISDYRKEYDSALSTLDEELGTIAHSGRKMALELAKKKLRDEYIGTSDKDFINKILKLPKAEFVNSLNKDWKSKLEARLGSYYHSNFKDEMKTPQL